MLNYFWSFLQFGSVMLLVCIGWLIFAIIGSVLLKLARDCIDWETMGDRLKSDHPIVYTILICAGVIAVTVLIFGFSAE